jgi:hypothetical protein
MQVLLSKRGGYIAPAGRTCTLLKLAAPSRSKRIACLCRELNWVFKLHATKQCQTWSMLKKKTISTHYFFLLYLALRVLIIAVQTSTNESKTIKSWRSGQTRDLPTKPQLA